MDRNLSLLADYYEFTMANGYVLEDRAEDIAYFEFFFRRVPDDGGYAVFAGLEQLVDYLQNLRFGPEEIEFFRKKGMSEAFVERMKDFRFRCDVWAMREGDLMFPGEPVIIVRGPIDQAQMVETMLLLQINHQSLIATKASRIVRVAGDRAVSEFGSRRAQGPDAANYGARASYIGGVSASANAYTDLHMGIPCTGTMAHSWVMSFASELESFRAYARAYPDQCLLLVDTYDVLRSGVPHAITVFRELAEEGHRPLGIRLDSGDIAYLSKEARKMLDAAGFSDAKIIASNSLDEFRIRDMLMQGAKIDAFGVGERLITAKSDPVFGGVYKLVALEGKDGKIIPKIKISEDVTKLTTPGFKQVYRLFDLDTGFMQADLVTLYDEPAPDGSPLEIFHPLYTWKRTTIRNYRAVAMLSEVFREGKLVRKMPKLEEIRTYAAANLRSVWEEVRRLDHPHSYYVDLSEKLHTLRAELLQEGHRG